MKISFLSDSLQTKISFLNHAVSQRGQLPILSNFLLEAKAGKLSISATDLEIGITSKISVNIEEEGRITVPAKNFSDLFANIQNQKITLITSGNTLKLSGENIKASFQTMPAEDFPKLFEEKGEEIINTNRSLIEKHLQKVVFASAIDSARPALSGILIDKEEKETILVATDGYRLSLQKNVFKTKQDLQKPLVVPARLIKELFAIKEDGDVLGAYISDKNNQILFFLGDTVLVGRLIEAEYPEYQKIIPTDFSTKVFFNRQDLQGAVKVCSIFARETANIVKLTIGENKIIVSANAPSVGEDSATIEAKVSGEGNEIAFNAKYLFDVLSAIDNDEMFFEMNGPLNPGVFKIKGDDSFLHLIMPIRVQE